MSCAIPPGQFPEWKKRFVSDLALRKEGVAVSDIQITLNLKSFCAGIIIGALATGVIALTLIEVLR